MSRAISNVIRVGAIAEVTPGTTPGTPAMQLLRATSESFGVNRLFTRSEEFNSTRAVAEQLLVANRAEGGFEFEWADGEVAIESFLESALFGAWSTDVLISGITPKAHSIEVKNEGGATDHYKLFTGMQVSEFGIDFKVAEKIIANFGFHGMSSTFSTSGTTGATYPAAGTELASVTGDMALSSTGLTVSEVTRLSMKVNNNLRVQQCLASFSPSGIGAGTFEVTGEIEMYLNPTVSVDWATNYLANTAFTLVATAGSTTLKKTKFTIPRAKFSSLTVQGQANDQDVMVVGNWLGVYDSSTGGAMKIERNIA